MLVVGDWCCIVLVLGVHWVVLEIGLVVGVDIGVPVHLVGEQLLVIVVIDLLHSQIPFVLGNYLRSVALHS